MRISDDLLSHYLKMKEEHKRLDKEIITIKNILIEAGSFATDNYVCAVRDQERLGIKPLEAVIRVFGRELIEEYDLLQLSVFKVVSVAKKL